MSTKDLGDLGVAAGDIFAKAFTLGYETGRTYNPAGGMELTAEQVDDVRTMLWSSGVTALAPYRRLREAFPATEPAEVRGNLSESPVSSPADPRASRAQDITRAWMRHLGYSEGEVDSLEHAKHEDYGCEREDGGWSCYGESGDSLHKDWDEYDAAAQLVMFVLDPAPAEPAEEETKAEAESDLDMHPDAVYGREYVEQAKVRRIARAVKECDTPSSSPVVPAPTETGPWQFCDMKLGPHEGHAHWTPLVAPALVETEWATVKSDGQQQNPTKSDVGNDKI